MNAFESKTVDAALTPPDPTKHVRYTQGMILGVDDFTQEFAYLSNRDQWLAREAIGYGTLSGLKIDRVLRDATRGPEISVSSGVALTPRGELVRVTSQQCASINAWLRTTSVRNGLGANATDPTGAATAYVVLCYRDCPVDPQPVPGEPCRCESEAMAPSRTMDDFCLELSLIPPPQTEEDALRRFVERLCQFHTTQITGNALSLEAFLQALRDSAVDTGSPSNSTLDFVLASPPGNQFIPEERLCEYLRAAFRLWITEFRPRCQVHVFGAGGVCSCGCDHTAQATSDEPRRECLLLGTVQLDLTNGEVAGLDDVTIDESSRPLLVHLRMLQEWMLCGCHCGGRCHAHTFATVFAIDPQILRIWIHHPNPVQLDASALTLHLDDTEVTGFTFAPVDTATDPDSAVDLNVFDLNLGGSPASSPANSLTHQQRIALRFDTTLISEQGSPRRLLADLIRQEHICYPDAENGHVTVFGVVELPDLEHTLVGDVTGPIDNNRITSLQGLPVNLPASVPNNSVLGSDGTQWHAVQLQAANTLPSAITFGAGGSAGTDPTRFAQADHVHPTPPLPAIPTATTVNPTPIATGAGPVRGNEASGFALGDHVHPVGRIQLGSPAIADPPGSDVRGTIGNNIVVGIQGVPVDQRPTTLSNGMILRVTGGRLRWQVSPFRVTSGLVIFQGSRPNAPRGTPDIEHGHDRTLVMIRLGLDNGREREQQLLKENTDTIFPNSADIWPRFMVYYEPRTPNFRIILMGPLRQQLDEVRVRWWAVPVTEEFEEPVVVRPDFDELPPLFLLSLIPRGGITRNALLGAVPVSPAAVDRALTELRAANRIRIANNRITPLDQ